MKDLDTIPCETLIKELMRRSTECIIGIKLFGANEPEYNWKGYEKFCEGMCEELSYILQPEEQYDEPLES